MFKLLKLKLKAFEMQLNLHFMSVATGAMARIQQRSRLGLVYNLNRISCLP